MAYVQEIQGVRAEKKNVLVVEFDALVGLTVESYSYTHLTPEDADEIRAAWKAKATKAHPDAGGSHAAMAEMNAARDAALKAGRP